MPNNGKVYSVCGASEAEVAKLFYFPVLLAQAAKLKISVIVQEAVNIFGIYFPSQPTQIELFGLLF